MKDNKFNRDSSEFALQVIARGTYLDYTVGDGAVYEVEAITIRLNHVALNDAWILSRTSDIREYYSTDEEWERHKAEYKAKRDAVIQRILNILGIDPEAEKESVSVSQSQTEVFTVVHISRILEQ